MVHPEVKGLYLIVIMLFYYNVRAAVLYAVKSHIHIHNILSVLNCEQFEIGVE